MLIWSAMRNQEIKIYEIHFYQFVLFQEREHQKDLNVLRQRLESLDNKQREQMDEMTRLHVTTTISESQVNITDEC